MDAYSQWSYPDYLRNPVVVPQVPTPQVRTLRDVPAWAGEDSLQSTPAWADGDNATWGIATSVGAGSAAQLSRAALYQIAKAYAGSRLSDMSQAEDVGIFQSAPRNDVGAYLKAAYWMAVAARLLGSRLLAASAQAVAARGNALLLVPLSGQFVGGIGTILRDSATTIRSYAGQNYAAGAVASQLDAMAAESTTLPAREEAAHRTISPFDDLAVLREKYGRRAAIGGGVVALVALTWLVARAAGRK